MSESSHLSTESGQVQGDVSIESHPALPQDRERHEALKIAIGDRLMVDHANAKYMKAHFETSHDGDTIVVWHIAVT